MTYWKLTLAYDGTAFHGWQVQPGLATVQGALSEALAHISGEVVLPQGSGRTDAGVHALGQVCSFALRAALPAANLQRALNRILPPAVRVLAATEVGPEFHARHSALRKTYEYRLFERRRPQGEPPATERLCSPFLAPFVWDVRWPLDCSRMQAAAGLFCGTHDFTSFAASDPDSTERHTTPDRMPTPDTPSPASLVRTIYGSAWERREDLLIYRVSGSGFLHHMVRNLVGTMVDVGRGRFAPDDVPAILAARLRSAAGPTAPARGLYLLSVEYGCPQTEEPAR